MASAHGPAPLLANDALALNRLSRQNLLIRLHLIVHLALPPHHHHRLCHHHLSVIHTTAQSYQVATVLVSEVIHLHCESTPTATATAAAAATDGS